MNERTLTTFKKHLTLGLSAVGICALAACGGVGPDGTYGAGEMAGVDGKAGAPGPAGDKGEQGETGAPGEDGLDGMGVSLLHASFRGLVDLGPDAAYEGWLIVDGEPVSTGVFHVTPDGYPTVSTFLALDYDVENAAAFVLTIEPSPDDDPAPSHTHVLGGDFGAGEELASLSVGHPAALGDDYTGASGGYILKTPSTNADDTDDRNGIWWLDPVAGPGAGFVDLPDLTDLGWRYEGWVVCDDGPISTGVFARADEADSDGAGPTAGPDALFSPPFPGQDFITTPIDLTAGCAAVLTIEPYPDNSPAPFTALKPLADDHIGYVLAPSMQLMANHADQFPTGTIVRAKR
jgi:hypothetical protein